MTRRLAILLVGASLVMVAAPPVFAAEQLSIPAARERAEVYAESTCEHDASCHNAGVQNCRRLADRIALCRIFDHRRTDEQGNFLCTRLVRLALQPPKQGVRVTGVSDWTC